MTARADQWRQLLLARRAKRLRALVRLARRLVQRDCATHECSDWPTPDGRACQLCNRPLERIH